VEFKKKTQRESFGVRLWKDALTNGLVGWFDEYGHRMGLHTAQAFFLLKFERSFRYAFVFEIFDVLAGCVIWAYRSVYMLPLIFQRRPLTLLCQVSDFVVN
jgi:hypothetical protein